MGLFESNPLILIPVVIAIMETWSAAKRAYWSLRPRPAVATVPRGLVRTKYGLMDGPADDPS